MDTTTYIAITIGPIYRTITQARKTRELWAASYIFSLLMRKLLDQFEKRGACEIILPYNPKPAEREGLPAGAGLWPDRCVLVLKEMSSPDMEEIIDKALDSLANDLGISEGKSLKSFFSINVLSLDLKEEGEAQKGAIPLARLNGMLDNLELASPFQMKEEESLNTILLGQIQDLYRVAGMKDSHVFVKREGGDGPVRLPSISEIAMYEFCNDADECIQSAYREVKVMIDRELDIEQGEEAGVVEEKSDSVYQKFKEELKRLGEKENKQKEWWKEILRLRHKYIAIVFADGDNVGKHIAELCENKASLSDFSKKLFSFSKEAVKMIQAYGGLSVYAGGDDLFFMAPVTNYSNEKADDAQGAACEKVNKNVFELCEGLNECFRKKLGGEKVSLSFGVSITYYKYPLGEAVDLAQKLLKRAKGFSWKDKNTQHEKQALAFQISKHSGRYISAVFSLEESACKSVLDFLKEDNSSQNDAFLASLIYKIDMLSGLLTAAARDDSMASFRKHHFNEGGKHEGGFLKEALGLYKKIYEKYTDVKEDGKSESDKEPAIQLFFALLRLKQFLIQKDRDEA